MYQGALTILESETGKCTEFDCVNFATKRVELAETVFDCMLSEFDGVIEFFFS
jgi:CO dehydrogenase/acetyl-CoA synthase gamma subunit (corrinoid Fe-S protein)